MTTKATATTDDREQLVEAVDDLVDALQRVYDAMPYDIRDALHDGRHGDLGTIPYALRNFLPDFEGADGGWLMPRGDSFIEAVRIFRDWISGDSASRRDDEEQ